MSERYSREINDLREWFKRRLPAFGKIVLTSAEYKAGTDSLTGFHADLVRAAFVEWLGNGYELSYNRVAWPSSRRRRTASYWRLGHD